MANVRYLVTGAAGNLGNSIVHTLVAQGKDVRALVLPGDKAAAYLPSGVEIFQGNILNQADLQQFFLVPKGTDIILIHSAGIVTTAWKYNQEVYNVNVLGTQNIMEFCLKSPVKKLVYISSVHAIPLLPKGQKMCEITDFEPASIIGFYGKTKAAASRIVMEAARKHGLNINIIFPSGLCGPYDYTRGYVTQLLIDCCKNKLPAVIEGGFDFADVRDVATGIISVCERGTEGEAYILGNRYVSIKEILQLVHELSGTRLIKRVFPSWTAYALLPWFGIYYKVKKTPPLFTKYSLYTVSNNSEFTHEKAKRELGYTVRPFRETISDTLQWLQAERLINYSPHSS